MKKKNGFTLVELMGVLVVLSIVILIATTNVFGNMTRAKKKAEKLSAKNYVTAVNDYNTMAAPANRVCGNQNVFYLNSTIKSAVSGKLPKSGTVVIDCNTYKVTSINIQMNNYTIKYSTTGTNANKYIIN